MAAFTEEMRAEIAETVQQALKDAGLKDIVRRFTPGGEVTKDETDKILEGSGPFKHFAHFAHSIWRAGPDGRGASEELRRWDAACKTAGYMEEGDASQGGYLVPPEFRAQLLMVNLEAAIVRGRALGIPMQTNTISLPAIADASHATSFFGGVTIYRPGELEVKTPSKPAFGKVTLTLHELVGLVHVSNQLLEDSPISLEPLLVNMFGQAIAFTEDDDFINGTGVNQALGAFNAANPSLIVQAKETGQPALTIVAQNIIKMWSRLHPAFQGQAIWLVNNDCFPQLATMSIAVGAGGIPVWLPAGGLTGTPYSTLMGRPCILTEKMQTLGTQGDIGLAAFSQYLIGDKGGIRTASSIHLKFDYNAVSFRFEMRYDGQPWWLSALTPKHSTATLSPFVVLAVRA